MLYLVKSVLPSFIFKCIQTNRIGCNGYSDFVIQIKPRMCLHYTWDEYDTSSE